MLLAKSKLIHALRLGLVWGCGPDVKLNSTGAELERKDIFYVCSSLANLDCKRNGPEII